MSETPTPETDAARLCGYGYFSGALVPVERKCYEKDPDGDVVFYEVAEKLERERDEARRELADALKEWEVVWNDVLEERKERNKAMRALEWIAGRYCHEKTTFQLAQEAYEMSSKARWTLQKIEQKEEA